MRAVICCSNHALAASAFDQIADSYDEIFTRSVIGRAQREAVRDVLHETFLPGESVLELNCGTGEDALYLARSGVEVLACDASEAMIGVAQQRKAAEGPELPIVFERRATETVGGLHTDGDLFDGAFSNFSGLNCIQDLRVVASDLANLTKDKARLVLCLSSRYCLWEILWFSARVKFRKAFRRVSGSAVARIGEGEVRVWYPTIKQVQQAFAPWFRLTCIRAVGLCVPPSYLEYWAAKHLRAVAWLAILDNAIGSIPFLRTLGDHVLLKLEKVYS